MGYCKLEQSSSRWAGYNGHYVRDSPCILRQERTASQSSPHSRHILSPTPKMTSPAALGRLASTSVHIQMVPSPRRIGETRQILAALQKFGEVTTFRNLKVRELSVPRNKHARKPTQDPILTVTSSTIYPISQQINTVPSSRSSSPRTPRSAQSLPRL